MRRVLLWASSLDRFRRGIVNVDVQRADLEDDIGVSERGSAYKNRSQILARSGSIEGIKGAAGNIESIETAGADAVHRFVRAAADDRAAA